MKYDIEPLLNAQRIVREFNQLDLETVELYRAGRPFPLSLGLLDDQLYEGVSNGFIVAAEVDRGNL